MIGRMFALGSSLLCVIQTSSGAEVAKLAFDHPSGFCASPFTMAIPAAGAGATVWYTTNGSNPHPAGAIRYANPISIRTTTILRAAAYDRETNLIATAAATYLFLPDVLNQSGVSFPKYWGTSQGQPVPSHYAMVTANGRRTVAHEPVMEGLRSLATLFITADPADLFSPDDGIYTHPLERGPAWERTVLLEMIETNNQPVFQCVGGLRIHGSISRRPEESPKHSFRLSFNSRHGAAKLGFPVFGRGGAQEFDDLVLRAGNNNSWLDSHGDGRRRADYIRDEWMRRSMLDMDHPSARGIFVHVYLNGLYWGLYNLCEKPGATLLSGKETNPATEFDVRKGGETESGDDIAWTKMMALANAGLSDHRSYEEMAQSLDITEFADYLVLNFYAGNSDWDRSANWIAVRPRIPGGRFQFLVWDAERTLETLDANTLAFDDDQSPMRLFHQLKENAVFRRLFADRARRLLFGQGALAPEVSAKRYHVLADSVARALAAEAARWGTYRRDVHQYKNGLFEGYTVEGHWMPEVNRIQTQYFPGRREILLSQFRECGLFPSNGTPAHD
jgi:hypothetical protein